MTLHASIYLFGTPRFEQAGQSAKLERHKAIALMAYLAVHSGPQSRNTLATLLWPEQDQKRARAALRRTLVTLRQAGLEPWIKANRETIEIDPANTLTIDIVQFRQLLSQCLSLTGQDEAKCIPLLTQAIDLYQADFLAGFSLRDSFAFDEWQATQTDNFRHDLTSALARLVRCLQDQADFENAILYARRWLELEPFYEFAHRQLMWLYTANGQRAAALQQYKHCVDILDDLLGVEPADETTDLFRKIQSNQLQSPQSPDEAEPSQNEKLHNFPAQPTPFLGRKTELAEITTRLKNPDCRLVSLIGPGGIGKTRLAVQIAREHVDDFSDGLFFVPLASVSSPDFLIPAIAQSLDLTLDEQADHTHQLVSHLKNRQLLLVLDNLEHLIKKISILSEILHWTTQTKILVTSRERLNLSGEWAVQIKGMKYPKNHQAEGFEEFSAIALFLHRAYRVHSGFKLTEADKPHIIRICQLMEGVPLGIELATSWVHMLSCQEIAREIEQMNKTPNSLNILTSPLQDLPERHQNLQDVFEYSWRLLTEAEQETLRKLSVFQGGCQREAIEQVTGATLATITTLVDKSMLSRRTSGRYEMHQLLRQYIAEKLRADPTLAELSQNLHCDYYLKFLGERQASRMGEKQPQTLAAIAKEIENIRAAWRWAVVNRKLDLMGQALETLWFFYAMYSRFQEGAETFSRTATMLRKLPQSSETMILLARILTYLGWLLLRQGRYEQAQNALDRSLDIFHETNSPSYTAPTLHFLGILALETGQAALGQKHLEKALTIYRETNNRWGIAWALSFLAYDLHQLDQTKSEESQTLLQESLTIYRSLGHKQGIAMALNNLGYIQYRSGNYDLAKTLLQESLDLRRKINYPRGIAVALSNLGHIYSATEEYALSRAHYQEAVMIARNIGATPLALAALGGLAVPYAHEKSYNQAMAFLSLVLTHPASNEETRDRAQHTLQQLRDTLPDQEMQALEMIYPLQVHIIPPTSEEMDRLVERMLG